MRSHGGDAAGGTVRLIVARPRRRIGNVPAEATSFVGRRRELAEMRKALVGARLVSLVGPGGVGKTRLAVRAATDHQRGFADGAWWVDLAEIRDPALVATGILVGARLGPWTMVSGRAMGRAMNSRQLSRCQKSRGGETASEGG